MFREGIYVLPTGLDEEELKVALHSLCLDIHQKVLQDGIADAARKGMGSTLVSLLYYEGRLIFISAGDSRVYRFRNRTLMQMSRDHSLRNLSGTSEAPPNIIVNSFGGGMSFYVDIEMAGKRILDGDVFLLCSDGVSDMLDDDEIEAVLASERFEDTLLDAARNKGGKDNISYVLVELSGVKE